METNWIVSTGAVSCYPGPVVKNLVSFMTNCWSFTVTVTKTSKV